ncbi:MAG: phosphodiester glycosidase family protein [Chloroflexi bacterium]|nr:phosphodiester glycosidase family protein [Chloroflexota bacterium]
MLRRLPPFRRAEATGSVAAEAAETSDAFVSLDAVSAVPGSAPVAPAERRRRRVTVKRVLLGLLVLVVASGAVAYPMRSKFTAQGADLSRRVIGDENTARIEGWYFRLQDRVEKTKYSLFGGETDPFADSSVRVDVIPKPEGLSVVYWVGKDASGQPAIADLFRPPPMKPPETRQLRDDPASGEGVWTTSGLPRSSPTDMLMAKTFIRPDKSRPYATVGVLLIDSRRVRLTMSGGTVDPGGDLGVKGPGNIPSEVQKNLLVAWNGGFKGPHGGFGMVADGKTYRSLRDGLASMAVTKDGQIFMGEWGRTLAWRDDFVAVRQNAVLLVENGEVSKRTAEGNDTWGYVNVNSAEFITWRSAVGLTKDGNLLVAAGTSLSAASLAQALWAAGAWTAMQLDINNPYVLTSLFFAQPDGSLRAERFMDAMPGSASRFLSTQERDFMYVTVEDRISLQAPGSYR